MSTMYFLVLLLGLAVLSKPTTAQQNGGPTVDELRQMPLVKHFHSRGWARIRIHPFKPIEKSLGRAPEDVVVQQAKLKPAGARRTMQRVEEKAPEDHTAGCSPGAKNNINAENNERAMPENKPKYFLPGAEKTTIDKLEEAKKDKPAGHRAKTTNIQKVENMHL